MIGLWGVEGGSFAFGSHFGEVEYLILFIQGLDDGSVRMKVGWMFLGLIVCFDV